MAQVNWTLILEFTELLVWPATILLAVFLARRQIPLLLSRIEKAKFLGGTELVFGYSQADRPSEKPEVESDGSTAQSIKWTRTGNLYWLSHDIMWTIDVLLRTAPKSYILFGLRQSMHHAKALGLGNTDYMQKLADLFQRVENVEQKAFTASIRDEMAVQLRVLSDQLGAIAQSNQLDFKAGPKGQ